MVVYDLTGNLNSRSLAYIKVSFSSFGKGQYWPGINKSTKFSTIYEKYLNLEKYFLTIFLKNLESLKPNLSLGFLGLNIIFILFLGIKIFDQ